MAELSPKQARFVEEYLVDLNATQAAIRAGYSPKTAGVQGYDLLKRPHIANAVAEGQSTRTERVKITGDWVLTRLVEIVERSMQIAPVPNVDGTWKYEPNPAARALELLGKHVGLFKDRVELTGKDGGPVQTQALTDREIAMRLAFMLTKAEAEDA